jgi:hypothetical protein
MDYPASVVVRAFILILLCGFLSALSLGEAPPKDVPLVTRDGKSLVDSNKRPVLLKHNPKAVDVPWKKVVDFIKQDDVNRMLYRQGKFECTEFALTLHERALAKGIRCAFVAVEFDKGEGHAVNAFNTTDRGLVFIDCTGSKSAKDNSDAYDSIAYLVRGKPFGRLPLDVGIQEPNRYAWYETIRKEWAAMDAWKKNLDAELKQLAQWSNRINAENAALQKYQNKTLPPGDYQRAQARFARHKANVDNFNRANALHTANALRFNQLSGLLRNSYETKPFPVKDITLWW